MSKEEILKIQVCVLKVNIHCDGCKEKVKKILQKIDGVFTTKIDAEQGKVTVSGNVDPSLLIKKLAKAGKRAELWGSQKPNNNNNGNNIHNQMMNQFKNMNINATKGSNDKGQKLNNNVNQGKGGNNPQQNQLQQQLQQIKARQNMMPQLKDQKIGGGNRPNQKAVKFTDEDDDEFSDDEYTDEFSDEFDEDDDDEFDDEIDHPHHPINKMMMNGLNPQFMNKGAPNGKQGGPSVSGNGGGGGGGKNGNGGQKGGVGNFNGGGKPQNGHGGGGGGSGGVGKDNNIPILMNGGKKPNNGGGAMNGGLVNMVGPGGSGQFGNMNIPIGQINNLSTSQMGNVPAVQGLPASTSAGNGYYQGPGLDMMAGNPINQQQQYLAMMNQQRAMGGGNERFQPMMYARPPPAVNYLPPPDPYHYTSPYPPHYGYGSDPYSNVLNDENTSSCNIM